ncbi:putative protein phosphatase 2C-type [Botrimarina hoheduenensis]|uniref:PPM-type phosphatase domain-containing protein n=2 Tax=Botrimarina hoheduenensis TaxID=2528000 RepID=A0A5C5WDW8_9BACT|nr:putative protein phosphatase 2C-type [Botrimarina hoheduenensis]
MRRANNQDSLSATPVEGTVAPIGEAFLMVADGMGAHAAGELASRMAADVIPQSFLKCRLSAPAALRNAIREANQRIHDKGNSAPEFHGMGTTCSCLAFSADAAMVGHVGDSRVYRLRGGKLEQLTFDHSLVWEMAAASNVSQDRVPSCIPKNVITRSLGPNETVNVDLEGPHDLQDGDTFLLCSDGLTGVVEDALAGSLIGELDPEEATQTLVDIANLRGGPDNISVIVAQVSALRQTPGIVSSRGIEPSVAAGAAIATVALAVFLWSLAFGPSEALMASAVACGIGSAIALARSSGVSEPQLPRIMEGPYGNGPYRSEDCHDLRQTAQTLRELVDQLALLCRGEETNDSNHFGDIASPVVIGTAPLLDWSPVEPLQQRAERSIEAGNFAAAIRDYAAVIRKLMQLVRADDGTHRYRAVTPGRID